MSDRPIQREIIEYQIGWITALGIELAAATALLDELHDEPYDLDRGHNDHNVYTWGHVSEHNVVLVSLPEGKYGLTSATTVVERLLSSLPHIKLGLLVGIGAGIPESGLDIRLGDVAVSRPEGDTSGVLQYDFGKEKDDGFQRVGMLAPPPDALLHALRKLRANHEIQDPKLNDILESAWNRRKKFRQKYAHPGPDKDHLFTTIQGSEEVEVLRSPRSSLEPEIHYGTIISGNRLIKTATKRCEIATMVGKNAICLEMEAAGLMNSFPCLVVRGISDYADTHKNDEWQRYAAATASAFAKELLAFVPKTDIARSKDMLKQLVAGQANEQEMRMKEKLAEFLQSIYPHSYEERKNRNPPRVPGTCQWFVSHPTFQIWLQSNLSLQTEDRRPILWVSADPGCGKSVLARYLIDTVFPISHQNIYYFFFKDDFSDQRTSINAIRALLHQLVSSQPNLLSHLITQKIDTFGDKMKDSFFSMWKVFLACINKLDQEVICVLDGLDECQASNRLELLNEARDVAATTAKLKFLLSTRPYDDIRKAVSNTESKFLTLHLSGESDKEREMISKEIDLVVAYRVNLLCKTRNLDEEEQLFLLNQLCSVPHRTYLWAHLTLEIIEEGLGFTRGNVRAVCAEIPPKIEAAYEKILNRSIDKAKTLKILLLIISAERPLEVGEMGILLALNDNQTKYSELEEFLEPDQRFRITLRNLCGFFVVIVDSKLYLLHQTAREFLLSEDNMHSKDIVDTLKRLETSYGQDLSPSWGHSISLRIAHAAMVVQSRLFLSLTGPNSGSPASSHLEQYCERNWFNHLEFADINYTDPFLDWIVVANAKASAWYQAISARTSVWYRVGSYSAESFDPQIEVAADYQLRIGAFEGLICLVKRALLITYSETPSDAQLSTVIEATMSLRYAKILQILLSFAAGIISEQNNLEKIRQKVLLTHMSQTSEELAQDTRIGFTISKGLTDSLTQGVLHAVQGGEKVILQLLLAYGANVHQLDWEWKTFLHHASDPCIVKILLDAGVNPNACDILDMKPLICHFLRSHSPQQCKSMQELLWTGHLNDLSRYYEIRLHTVRRPNNTLETPLHIVLRPEAKRCSECIRFILNHYDNIEEATPEDQSLLDYAKAVGAATLSSDAEDQACDELVSRIMSIDYHGPWKWDDAATEVEHNCKDVPKTRPTDLLAAIVYRKPIKYLVRLIRNRADMNATDAGGRTFVHCAIQYKCGVEIIRLLIENGTDITLRDRQGRSAIHYAAPISSEYPTFRTFFDTLDVGDKSALQLPVKSSSSCEYIQFLLEYANKACFTLHGVKIDMINMFVAAGVAVDARISEAECTPLCVACMQQPFRPSSLDLVKCLLEHGADPRISAADNCSALSFVRNRLEAIQCSKILYLEVPLAVSDEEDQLRQCLNLLEHRSHSLDVDERYETLFSALENPDQLNQTLDIVARDQSATQPAWDLCSNLSLPTEDEFSEGDDMDVDSDEAICN